MCWRLRAEREVDEHLGSWLASAGDVPLFLIGISGLGSPFWVADFPSRFVGKGEPWEKLVAVLESVVFLIKVNLEEMATHVASARQLVVTGGLAGLDGLSRRLADLCEVTVVRPRARAAGPGPPPALCPDVLQAAGAGERARPGG